MDPLVNSVISEINTIEHKKDHTSLINKKYYNKEKIIAGLAVGTLLVGFCVYKNWNTITSLLSRNTTINGCDIVVKELKNKISLLEGTITDLTKKLNTTVEIPTCPPIPTSTCPPILTCPPIEPHTCPNSSDSVINSKFFATIQRYAVIVGIFIQLLDNKGFITLPEIPGIPI